MVLLADYGPAWEAWLVVRVWLLPDPVARLIHARRDARVHQMVLRVMHEVDHRVVWVPANEMREVDRLVMMIGSVRAVRVMVWVVGMVEIITRGVLFQDPVVRL